MTQPPVQADYSKSNDDYKSGAFPEYQRAYACRELRRFNLALQGALRVDETAVQRVLAWFLKYGNHMAEPHHSSLLSECASVGVLLSLGTEVLFARTT